jgi:hypothetical protein
MKASVSTSPCSAAPPGRSSGEHTRLSTRLKCRPGGIRAAVPARRDITPGPVLVYHAKAGIGLYRIPDNGEIMANIGSYAFSLSNC